LVMDYIRRYGFDPRYQANYTLEYGFAMDKFETDQAVEQMVAALVLETRQLLESNKPLLLAIAHLLYDKGSLDAKQVAELAATFGKTAAIKEEGYLHLPGYEDTLQSS